MKGNRALLEVILLLVIGIVLIVIGILGRAEVNRYRATCTSSVKAEVMSTESRKAGNGKHKHTEYRAELKLAGSSDIIVAPWSNKKYTKGDTVEVDYDPSAPTNIYVPSNPPFAARRASGNIGMGITCLVLAALIFGINYGYGSKKPVNTNENWNMTR